MTTPSQAAGPVAVVGTTTWGTTLALILARRGIVVRLLARTSGEAQALSSTRENPRLLGFPFPESLSVTDDWASGLGEEEIGLG